MADPDQPAEKDLVGIKGWLLLYVIGPGILGTLFTVTDVMMYGSPSGIPLHPAYWLIFSVFVTGNVIGLYLIFGVRKPITRTYHIWLNFIWASIAAFTAVVGTRTGWGMVLGLLIWAAYWIGSKRVRATYCQDVGQIT